MKYAKPCQGHCKDGAPCNKLTGKCDGGCSNRWNGTFCERLHKKPNTLHNHAPQFHILFSLIPYFFQLLSPPLVTHMHS